MKRKKPAKAIPDEKPLIGSTRTELIKRGLIYSLMSGSVIVIVTLLMLAVLGYSFNPKDNSLEQGGLLQFRSVPSGAMVTLDEVQLGSRTPNKVTAHAANHNVTMTLDGYRSWHKSINLKPGMIGWLSYARLIPTDLKAQKIRALPTLGGVLGSPDHKWLAMVEDVAKPTVLIADLQNEEVKFTSSPLPTASFTPPAEGKTQAFTVESWSSNGQFILVKHVYDDVKIEWLVVNREDPTKTKNISARLGLNSPKVVFASNDGKIALAVTEGAVRRLNLSDETLSRPLVTNVDEFAPYGDDIVLYTTKGDAVVKKRTAGYLGKDMEQGQQLAEFPDDGQPIHMAMSQYFGERYIATSHGVAVHVSKGELPHLNNKGNMKTVITLTANGPPTALSFNGGGRFVVVENSNAFMVHDLELVKTDTTMLKDVTGTARPLRWLDDSFRTWYDGGGMLRLYEFDGANQQNIVPVAEGYDVVISPNKELLYSIGRDASGLNLQRVRLVLK